MEKARTYSHKMKSNKKLFFSRMDMMNTTMSMTTDGVENITMGNETMTTENTFLQQLVQLMTYKVAKAISKYWFKFLVPIGLIGNTLSFLVMMKPSNRKMSTCIYMASISVNDNLMMFLAMYAHVTNDINVHQIGSFECKVIAFLVLMSLQNTTYQVLLMTIDKFIAIKWPHKAATYSTPRRAKITLVCVHIFVLLYNIPHLFISGLKANICIAYLKPGLFTPIHSWLSFVLNFIVPFSLLFFINLVIIQQVKRSHQRFGERNTSTEVQSDNNPAQQRLKTQKNVENQLTRMLVLVTSLFLILLVPTYVRFIFLTIFVTDTPEKQAAAILLYHISAKLYNTSSGLNFFLYCISGQKFRSDLKELLCCSGDQKDVKRKSETSGTTVSSVDVENGSKTSVSTTMYNVSFKVRVASDKEWISLFLLEVEVHCGDIFIMSCSCSTKEFLT